MPLNPFDWTGGPFLWLYIVLFLIASVASAMLPKLVRGSDGSGDTTDPEQLAYLAGGPTRWAEVRVAERLVGGRWRVDGRHVVDDGGERWRWNALRDELAEGAAATGRQLRRAGMLVAGAALPALRRAAAGPFAALAVFGTIKLAVGVTRERPVGFLTILLALTVIAAVVRWIRVDQRTPAGHAALDRAMTRHDRLRIAPTRPEMALGVALFGTSILVGSEFGALHDVRRRDGGDGGSGGDGGGDSGGCGSSDSGGGCGGGGCGGCGS